MNKITLWHVIGVLVLVVALTSLLPGVPGVREMAADVRAGWLLDQAVEHLYQQHLAEIKAFLQPGARPVRRPHLVQAEAALKQALACRPHDPGFRRQLIDLLVQTLSRQKKWMECAALIETSLLQGVAPEGGLPLALASCYDQVHDYRRAEALYEEYLERHPEDPVGCNDLAYHYAQRGVRLDRALDLIKRALEEAPNEGAFVDTLGWIYYRKGWLRQAEIELLRARKLLPLEGQAEILYHLGVVYAEQGHHEQAVQVLSQALRLQPDLREAAELLRQEQRRYRPKRKVNV